MSQNTSFSGFGFSIPINSTDDKLPKKSSDHEYSQPKVVNPPPVGSSLNLKETLSTYDLSKAGHPMACIFTVIFKILAVSCYYTLEFFEWSKVVTFIIVTIFCALDFWTLKNVTGRLLVGLRWWSDFKEDGSEVWIFESYDGTMKLNSVDVSFFWTPQIFFAVFWALLLIYHMLTLNIYWGMLNGLSMVLVGINLVAFYKCSKEHKKKVEEMEMYVKAQGLKLVGNHLLARMASIK